jgi:thioesterase domain-containing protein
MFEESNKVRSGWSDLAVEGAQVHEVPGEHGAVLDEPLIGEWVSHVRTLLDDARGNHSSYQSSSNSSAA